MIVENPRKLVFATNNTHKISEITPLLSAGFEIISLQDIGCFEDIPETAETLEGNALQKAMFVYERYQVDCFADDTGLEIEALNGQPGVYSARYAGEEKSFEKNMDKVLLELQGKTNRKARFRCVIALILDGKKFLFEGIVNGVITEEKSGKGGFGYDPIFKPYGFDRTFAEMNLEEKNRISHRGLAVQKFITFLSESK
jgi:XTP/dITP diphosphohydrolase